MTEADPTSSEGVGDVMSSIVNPRGWWAGLRHPIAGLRQMVGDGPLFALLVLFGLNVVDELDRSGFGILLPTIRDHFGMTDTGILSLVALTALGALLLQMPIAIWADRGSRVRIAVLGGIAWGVFSFFTGLSTSVLMLVLVRSGAGIGVGVRIDSPVGPLRLECALSDRLQRRFHLGIGSHG